MQAVADLFRRDSRWLALYAALSAFCVYSCMYAFRKPFTAATFDGMTFWGINYKVWLVIAQTCGYALSKFYGIRFIAELAHSGRRKIILVLIFAAWAALLGFALVPSPYNILFLFLNGIPLGMVFGVVFSYLEGRKQTEFLGAVLASSFVFSSGMVRSVGKWLMLDWSVSVFWMPFLTGALFAVPTLLFAWLLDKVPPPDDEDRQARQERKPMGQEARREFVRQFRGGLVLLVVVYMLLTVLRDVRDNFSAEIWEELGYGGMPAIFTNTEIPVTILVLLMMSLLVLVKDNFRALRINHALVVAGFAISFLSTLLFRADVVSAPVWFTATGLGLYMGYIPFNCLLFDRLLATFRYPGNVGFIMYISDAFGYLGSVSVLMVKELARVPWYWNTFFQQSLLLVSLVSVVLMALSWRFFRLKKTQYDA